MDKNEIIERLKNIAGHAVYTVGGKPFVMSLDDGIAVHEAIELLEKTETNCPEIPDSCDVETVEAIPVPWNEAKMQWLREHNGAFYDPAYFLETMLQEWREEQKGSAT